VVLLITAGRGVAVGGAQPPPLPAPEVTDSVGPPPRLEVPYLAQSVLLCGGAAIAMVERWWGRRGVYPEDFADLVRPALGGILTTDLVEAVRARGWTTELAEGTPALARARLREGVPVVALIRVGPDRYHYVVLLDWRDGRVVFHDPAAAPYTTVDEPEFLARWDGADRWALVMRPTPAVIDPPPPPLLDSAAPPPMPCSPWLARALDAALTDQLEEANRLLVTAADACPDEPLILRETAAIRFKQGRHPEAIELAMAYLARVPDDRHGWQLLATSRFLTGDRAGALEAWNRAGRPTIDLVRVDGTRHVRFREIVDALSVAHRTMLTPAGLALARRRVAEIPALRWAVVDYQPVVGGVVEVRATVVERPRLPRPWRWAAAGVIRALAHDEAALDLASLTGGGELWSGAWRWASARPRLAVGVAGLAHIGLPGILQFTGAREQFRLALDPATATTEETRRFAQVGFGGWLTAALRPSVALRLERWSANRAYLTAAAGVAVHTRDDRLILTASGEHALALASHRPYTRGSAGAMWASAPGLTRAAWSARLGVDWTSRVAPVGTWPVVGGNLSWAIPLRAEPLAAGGLVAGRSTGRAIVHAGVAADHPVLRVGPLVIAAGAFVDAAHVRGTPDGSADRRYLDGGGGVRIGIADGQFGVLRIDLARGLLEDGRSALSVGVHRQWPFFPRDSR
jgi:hypothetical protein